MNDLATLHESTLTVQSATQFNLSATPFCWGELRNSQFLLYASFQVVFELGWNILTRLYAGSYSLSTIIGGYSFKLLEFFEDLRLISHEIHSGTSGVVPVTSIFLCRLILLLLVHRHHCEQPVAFWWIESLPLAYELVCLQHILHRTKVVRWSFLWQGRYTPSLWVSAH